MPSRALHLPRLAVLALLLTGLLGQAAPAAAAPPPNDARAAAQDVGPLPATLRGTTAEATLDEDEPVSSCGPGKNSVWYSLRTPEAREILFALDAAGDMDATVEVFSRVRSQLSALGCQRTNQRGEATLELDAAARGDYLIRVAALANSVTEAFTLRVIAPDRPAAPPGPPLPAGGTSGEVDRFANPDDAWSVRLRKGRTYRMNFVGPGPGCPTAELFAPGTSGFNAGGIRRLRCDAQTLYTPPESGRYTVHLRAPRASRARLDYRLRVGRAGADDTAPGLVLANDDRVGGSLQGSELDALDLYRFSVARRSDLNVRLSTSRNFQAVLITAGGRRLAAGSEFDRRIAPGRYFLAVRAQDGDSGRYVLRRLARTITRSRTLADGQRTATLGLGGDVDLSLAVSPAVDGRATLLVERFDPLAGWLFDARFHPRLGGGRATVSFRPPTVGRWRVTGEFDGSRRASPSRGGTAEFTVIEPVTDG
jgi:hypothetical protein